MVKKKGRKHNMVTQGPEVSSRESEENEVDIVDQLAYGKLVEVAIGVGCLVFTIYAYTTYPSVPGGDSGELLSAACEGGVAHPPGYPLWTLLSSLFIYLLPLAPAYSVNLLTCACGALASSVLFVIFYRFSTSWTISMISAFVFSFAPLMWTWSITGEVFALNNVLTASLILILIEFELASSRGEREKMVHWGAFVSGLALTNQHTVILYLPAIVCRVFYRVYDLKELTAKLALSVIVLASLGLSPYLYLIISSYINTARWSWGDQSTVAGFFKHLSREEYGTFKLGREGEGQGFISNLIEYKQSLLDQLTLPGYSLACIGIVQTFIESDKRLRRAAQTCFAMMICYVSFFCWRANLDINKPLLREVVERFWIQPNIVWVTLIALGCKLLYIQLNLKSFTPMLMKISAVILVLSLFLARSWSHCNHHDDIMVRDFASAMLHSLPNNSLVLTKGDLPSGTLRYMQFCEGKRPDVTLVEQELMTYDWFIPKLNHLLHGVNFPGGRWHNVVGTTTDGLETFNMLMLLDANTNNRPVFVCIGMQELEASWQAKYHLLPYGACHQVVKQHEDWVEHVTPYNDTWSTNYQRFREGSWEAVAYEEMWNAKISKALYLYNAASETQNRELQSQLYQQSYEAYSQVLKTHSAVPGYFHKNYALANEKMARYSKGTGQQVKAFLAKAVTHFELYIPLGEGDPQLPAIHEAVKSLKAQIG